jgi:hypothetical protein
MLYGSRAAPNDSAPHIAMVTKGVAHSSAAGAFILYHTDECLCLNSSKCLTEGDPLFIETTQVRLLRFLPALEKHHTRRTSCKPMLTARLGLAAINCSSYCACNQKQDLSYVFASLPRCLFSGSQGLDKMMQRYAEVGRAINSTPWAYLVST